MKNKCYLCNIEVEVICRMASAGMQNRLSVIACNLRNISSRMEVQMMPP